MSDRTTLLTNILEQPADDDARGVYADWLREQPDATSQALGQFIWAGVTLARYERTGEARDGEWWEVIKQRDTNAPVVLAGQCRHLFEWPWEKCGWDVDGLQPDHVVASVIPGSSESPPRRRRRKARVNPALIYQRGMPHTLRVTLPVWLERAEHVLALCPIERVELVDVPGLVLTIEGPGENGEWPLSASFHYRAANGPAALHSESRYASSREVLLAHVAFATANAIETLRWRSGFAWPGTPATPAQDDLLGQVDPDVLHRTMLEESRGDPFDHYDGELT